MGSETQSSVTDEERYRNALEWIRITAGMHYLGGAFDPEHMRDICNLASDVLNGKELPDFEGQMAEAEKRAQELAGIFSELFRDPDDKQDQP